MKRTGLIAFLIGCALTSAFSQVPVAQPKLVLVLSIDQMRFDYLTRFGTLPSMADFKTLMDRGAVFRQLRAIGILRMKPAPDIR